MSKQLSDLSAADLRRLLEQGVEQLGGLAGASERALVAELIRRASEAEKYLEAYVRQVGRAEQLPKALETYMKDHHEKRWPDEQPCPCWLCREAREALQGLA